MERVFKLSGIADECGDSIYTQVDTHKKLGWDYIEIRNVNKTTIDTMDETLFEEVVQVLSQNNMKVSSLASDLGKLWLGNPDQPFDLDVATLHKLIGYSKRLDSKFIRVMGYMKGTVTDEEWFCESVERLRVLSAIAQQHGIFLALENCMGWYADSGKKMAAFLDKIGSDHCVCLYDTGNPSNHHHISAWDYYDAVKERIAYIHVKDGAAEGCGFTYPGEGVSDVCRILEAEYKRGYRGFVSIEPHMSVSAHKPNLAGTAETSLSIYTKYGQCLNAIVETYGSGL